MKGMLLLAVLLAQFHSQAQPWKNIGKILDPRNVVKAAVDVATAPAKTAVKAVNIARGASKPQEIFDPYKQALKSSTGAAAEKLQANAPVVKFLNAPQELMYRKADEYVAKHFGGKGRMVFDYATFTQRFYNELAPTAQEELIQVLKNENPLIVLGAPLAAAIHAAETKYAPFAKPLPDDVKAGLQKYFKQEILAAAKYTVGRAEITLPNVVGKGKKFMGEHYAVVVGNTIVFNAQPPSFNQGAWWWGHEVMHVEQYNREGGIEVFAYNYLTDLGKSLEGEADRRGDEVIASQLAEGKPIIMQPRTKYFGGSFANSETLVAQCILSKDTLPTCYVLTSTSKILAVQPLTGEYLHVGYAKTSKLAGFQWDLSTPTFTYYVLANGDIMKKKKDKTYEKNGTVLKFEQ